MVSGGHTNTVREDEGIGAVQKCDVPPANDDPRLLAQQEGVEAEVVDAKIQPALPWKPVVPVTVA